MDDRRASLGGLLLELLVIRRTGAVGFVGDTPEDHEGRIVEVAGLCDVATSHTADVKRFVPVSEKLKDTGIPVSVLLADKGYDAEYIHLEARRIFGFGISTQIPARNCKSPKAARQEWKNAPKGYHRRMMDRSLDLSVYRFRSIVETVNSMLKRKMGETVYGKTMESVSKEIRFTALAHNLRLIMEGGLIRF